MQTYHLITPTVLPWAGMLRGVLWGVRHGECYGECYGEVLRREQAWGNYSSTTTTAIHKCAHTFTQKDANARSSTRVITRTAQNEQIIQYTKLRRNPLLSDRAIVQVHTRLSFVACGKLKANGKPTPIIIGPAKHDGNFTKIPLFTFVSFPAFSLPDLGAPEFGNFPIV